MSNFLYKQKLRLLHVRHKTYFLDKSLCYLRFIKSCKLRMFIIACQNKIIVSSSGFQPMCYESQDQVKIRKYNN